MNHTKKNLNLDFDTEKKRHKKGCFQTFFILFGCCTFFLIVFIFCLYVYIIKVLPDISDLRAKASQFETLRIMDRKENLLYEIVPPETGRRDYVTLEEISPYVIATVIAAEDQDYYNHPGFDLYAIVRAFFQNAELGETYSGASTITQQLARNLLMSHDERMEKTATRKIKEIILAAEITGRYSKDEILEIYLNENYYGNYAYGIEAAAQTYFQKSAKNLDFAEAAFLSGLPQAPGYYNVFDNRDAVLARLKTVLLLTYNQAAEKGCIFIHSGKNCVSVDPLMVSNAIREIENYNFIPGHFSIKYPHWVNYVYQILEEQYGAEALYRSGYTVYTTLDPSVQDVAEEVLKNQTKAMRNVNVHNGAVIVLDPQDGDILAMVGSPDFYDSEHSGQVNMAISPRQPGSAIKPFIYAAAFEKGWTPSTLIWDVETDFSPNGKPEELNYSQPYHPVNYDGQFHGPVLVREALASSLNIPAVKALQFTGIYDDPMTEQDDGFISFARRLHIDSLNKAGYGLALALGGGEMTLLELTNAYGVFADQGRFIPSRAILKIKDHRGNVIYEAEDPPAEKVLKETYAYQITSILSDDNARSLGFGTGSVLNLSFSAAVKTGTTNDYRDNWTVGYNDSIVVGVWLGNADNTPMAGSSGISGAAPVWHEIMEKVSGLYPEIRKNQFIRPMGIRDVMICGDTGDVADQNCVSPKWEIFDDKQLPPSENNGLIRNYYTDTWSGKLVSVECAEYAVLKQYLNVFEKEAQNWIKNTSSGRIWAERIHAADLDFIPEGTILYPPCGFPILDIVFPENGTTITEELTDITAVVYALDGIYEYSVEFASAEDPDNWMVIQNDLWEPQYIPSVIAVWNLNGIENGNYMIRVRIKKDNDLYFETKNSVYIEHGKDNEFLIPGDEGMIDFIYETPDLNSDLFFFIGNEGFYPYP